MALGGLPWGPGTAGSVGETQGRGLMLGLGPWAGCGEPQESDMGLFTMGRLGEPWSPQDPDGGVG